MGNMPAIPESSAGAADVAVENVSSSVDGGSERRGRQPLLHLLGRRRSVRPSRFDGPWWKFVAQLTIP
jgi:hypothetical protein